MALNRLKEWDLYIRLLRENQTELELLYRDLLIKQGEALRIWIRACSSGGEACSRAISLVEYKGDKAFTTPIQIC